MKVSLVKAVAKVKAIAKSKLEDKEFKKLDGLLNKVMAVKEVKVEPTEDIPKSGSQPKGTTKTSENK